MKHDSHDICRHFPFSFFQFNLQSVELVQHCHTMHFHVMRFSVNPLGGFKCRARALCTLYNRGRITASRENCPVTQSADEMMSIGNFNLPVFYLAFMLVFVKKKKKKKHTITGRKQQVNWRVQCPQTSQPHQSEKPLSPLKVLILLQGPVFSVWVAESNQYSQLKFAWANDSQRGSALLDSGPEPLYAVETETALRRIVLHSNCKKKVPSCQQITKYTSAVYVKLCSEMIKDLSEDSWQYEPAVYSAQRGESDVVL